MTVQSTTGAGQSAPTGGSSSSTSALMDPLANKEAFLKLLVAQLQNQDPLNPTDPTQFLSQLTEISGVEQMVEMRQDLDTIQATLTAGAANTGTAGANGTSGPSNAPGSSNGTSNS